MTFKEMIMEFCEKRELFPDQAEAVLEKVLAIHPEIEERINEDTSDYPEIVLIMVLNATRAMCTRVV